MDPLPDHINNIATIKHLIESGTDPNKPYGHCHDTLLHHASRNNHIEIVKYLISHGANINQLDSYDSTALHEAAIFGHIGIVQYLIQSNTNIHNLNTDIINSIGHTPLHRAICGMPQFIGNIDTYKIIDRYLEIIKCLIESGMNIDAIDKDHNTPLHFAVRNIQIVQLLLDHGADKECVNIRGQTADMVADDYGLHEVAGYIREYKYVPTKGVYDE